MLALIDGDIVVHRVGFTTENEELRIAIYRAEEMLDGILLDTSATEFRIYLSDTTENGFRRQIYPPYKANRKAPKPRHYDALKEYLITEWKATIAVGQEADDALGIAQTYCNRDKVPSVICSIDKDLLQIPGNHWNFVKKEWSEVSPLDGLKKFYSQLLTGDTADNVKGVRGIGPVKAERLFHGITEESALFRTALSAYESWLQKEWAEKGSVELPPLDEFQRKQMCNLILTIGQVLKIRQEEDEIWQFPKEFLKLQPTLGHGLSSTLLMEEELTQSTEPMKVETESGLRALGQS